MELERINMEMKLLKAVKNIKFSLQQKYKKCEW